MYSSDIDKCKHRILTKCLTYLIKYSL